MKINEASLVFVYRGTHVRFINNRAEEKGGAIYVKTSCMDSSVSTLVCFIQPAPPYYMTAISEFIKLMMLEFVNNSAKVSGDALYGGDFDQCSTTLPYYLNKTRTHTEYHYSIDIFNALFNIEKQLGLSVISSDPRKVCFCSKSPSTKSCTTMKIPIQTYPGQEFTVSVVTIGQNGRLYIFFHVHLVFSYHTLFHMFARVIHFY